MRPYTGSTTFFGRESMSEYMSKQLKQPIDNLKSLCESCTTECDNRLETRIVFGCSTYKRSKDGK